MYTFKMRVINRETGNVLGYVIKFPCGLVFIKKCEMDLLYGKPFTNGRVTSCGSVIFKENIRTVRRKVSNGTSKKKKNDINKGRKGDVTEKVKQQVQSLW